jgi:hypothetical protein
MTDIDKTKEIFESGKYTCVLCKGEKIHTSILAGISPLLTFLNDKTDLNGFSASDKIVGKAAALLFVYAGVTNVYATVMSEEAVKILLKHNLTFSYKTLTPAIINRNGTGPCPMEDAVKDIDNPEMAYNAIRIKVEKLKNRFK